VSYSWFLSDRLGLDCLLASLDDSPNNPGLEMDSRGTYTWSTSGFRSISAFAHAYSVGAPFVGPLLAPTQRAELQDLSGLPPQTQKDQTKHPTETMGVRVLSRSSPGEPQDPQRKQCSACLSSLMFAAVYDRWAKDWGISFRENTHLAIFN